MIQSGKRIRCEVYLLKLKTLCNVLAMLKEVGNRMEESVAVG
jgi:hypothetical protein